MQLRILICDDNPFIIDNLREMVKEYFDEHKLQAEITTESSSRKIISAGGVYDIAFIDVEMPDYSGLDVTRHLQHHNSEIIIFIVTSHFGYLDDAMDLRVFRYLPKPPDKERIYSGLNSAMERYARNTRVIDIDGSNIQRVYVKDILYITINGRKTLLITKYGEFKSDSTMGEWKSILKDLYFAQPHYSYLVNLQNISRIEKDIIIMENNNKDKISIKIAQRKYSEFRRMFLNYMSDAEL